MKGPVVSCRLWHQATDSKELSATTGADNASRTHRPGEHIRSVCWARDRARAESHVTVAGLPSGAAQTGGDGSASARCQGDWARGFAGGVGVALRAAQA